MKTWYFTSRLKLYYLLVLLLMIILFATKYISLESALNYTLYQAPRLEHKDSQSIDNKTHGSFEIFTPTCRIPKFDPFDKEILSYVENVILPCRNTTRLILSNDTSLIINEDAFKVS